MKVYFTSSGQFYKEDKPLFEAITKSLEKYAGKKPYIALGDINYEKDTEQDIVTAVQKMEKQLKDADVVVTENTYSKAGIGFDIATALNLKKPVLVLYQKKESERGPHPINKLKYKLLSYKNYHQADVEQVIKTFLQNAKQQIDTKFILIISPQIEKYLEWTGDTRRRHKAQIVRQAVEDMIDKDKEYKNYLKV